MGVGQAPRRSGHRPWESLDRCWAVFTTSSGTTAACVYLAGLYRPRKYCQSMTSPLSLPDAASGPLLSSRV